MARIRPRIHNLSLTDRQTDVGKHNCHKNYSFLLCKECLKVKMVDMSPLTKPGRLHAQRQCAPSANGYKRNNSEQQQQSRLCKHQQLMMKTKLWKNYHWSRRQKFMKPKNMQKKKLHSFKLTSCSPVQ
jgi:hypothetical protein